ncbi:MAG: formate/nitrite transporter family protein [Candidatus Caldatribacteriota bacterium]|nr:formate/nitrite transporter family protein [Candidatus Caldatribacteriota bacterium]
MESKEIQEVKNVTPNFLAPGGVAKAIIGVGKAKTSLSVMQMIILGILAGAFIGFGSELATMVSFDMSKYLGVGFTKFIFGSVFSVGLILVVIAGAELFTGNSLIFVSVLNGDVKVGKLINNWFWVYLANFAGSLILVWIMYASGLWKTGNLGVGVKALAIANGKVNLSWGAAFARAIGCNWLVCLAVWLAVASKDIVGKIFAIYFPIMAFVTSGFEHCVANMYFVPMGLLLKSNVDVVAAAGLTDKLANLTWGGFIVNNLIPVTLGNIVGGAFFVSTLYWAVYLKGKK